MFKSILRRLGIKIGLIHEDYTSIESLRKRGVKIGDNVDIIDTLIDWNFGFLCSIGNNVTLTGVRILTHDASTKKLLGYSKIGKVEIGDNVFVGKGSIILPNVRIGNNVIVGAGTVIAKDVPDNVVVAGNPWRVLCTFEEYLSRQKENMHNRPVFDLFWDKLTEDDKSLIAEGVNSGVGFIY